MQIRNERGANTEHCGTPGLIFLQSEHWPFKTTFAHQFRKIL